MKVEHFRYGDPTNVLWSSKWFELRTRMQRVWHLDLTLKTPHISLLLVEKQKSLSVSCIILPPRVVVGQKGRVTISIEGRRADQVQTAWFLNDVPIVDTSYTGNSSQYEM